MVTNLFERYPELEICKDEIRRALSAMTACYKSGGKILLCGNGGSAADCDHIVGELMKGFLLRRDIKDTRLPEPIRQKLQGALPAISLPSQTAAMTAFINDVDPSMAYAQLLYGYARAEDLFVGISTSGNAANVVNAAVVAKAIGIKTLALTGQASSALSDICDITIRVPDTETYKIQELHLPIYHYLCAKLEECFFGE